MPSFDMSIPVGHWVEDEYTASQWMQHFLVSHKINNGLGLDTETTGLDIVRDRPIVWSLSDGANRICLPAKFLPMFRPILENPEVKFDLTRAKFDAHMIANYGVDISKAGEWRSTDVQSWYYNENNQGRHGLKECITDHFGRVTPTFEQTFGKVPNKKIDKATGRNLNKTVGQIIEEAFKGITEGMTPEQQREASQRKLRSADYASLDSYNSTVLRAYFDSLLEKIDMGPMGGGMSVKDYYYKFAVPFTKVLWKMERRGITMDRGHFKQVQGPMEEEMESIRKEFSQATTALSGQTRIMNLNSVADVRFFFYTLLQKEVKKMTDGGSTGNKQPSTDADVLDGWAGEGCQWARKLLKYREIAKTYGTYVVGLQAWIDSSSRIHTTFNQTGAVTGRLSSKDPNLQNIPRPGEDAYKIREGFVAGERKSLIVIDYQQMEMRLMACFSGDEKMINAINSGEDIHCRTVAEMEGIPYDVVNSAKKAEKAFKEGKLTSLSHEVEELLLKRQNAKATGFGIIYGIQGPHLAANLTKDTGKLVTEQEGIELIAKWFSVFPNIQKHIERTKEEIWKYGYVQTITGRFRRFGDLRSMNRRDRAMAERQGVNAQIQGSAADIAMIAMIAIEEDEELKKHGYKMLLQVHDEIVGECDDNPESVTFCKERVKYHMENSLGLSLPVKLPADAGSGHDWAHAK